MNLPEKKRLRTQLLIIFLFSIVLYLNALPDGFVHDDKGQVVDNRWIRDVRSIPEIFSKGVWAFKSESSNYYRPMMHLFYMAAYHIFGLTPWGFHLVNMLLHAGVSVLVFLLASKLIQEFGSLDSRLRGNDKKASEISFQQPKDWGRLLSPPFIAGLLFAAHPIHTEAVTWIAGLPDVSVTFFYLLSFYLYILSGRERGAAYASSIVVFCLSALSKETALTLPALIAVYDLARPGRKENLSFYLKRYIPFIAAAGIYLVVRLNALGSFSPFKAHEMLSAYQVIISVFPLIAQYIWKLLVPLRLSAFYTFHPLTSVLETKAIVSLAVAACLIFLFVLSFRKSRPFLFCLSFIMIPLLPALYIPAIPYPFAERYLYLPSFGFVMFIAFLLAGRPAKYAFVPVIFLCLTVAYSVGTVSRNPVWKNELTLWSDAVEKSPDGALPHFNLGNALKSGGRTDEALKHYITAARLGGDGTDVKVSSAAHNNIGELLQARGMIDRAVEEYSLSLMLYPNANAHNNIAAVYAELGMKDKAVKHFIEALTLEPDLADAHYNLGLLYIEMGQKERGIGHLEEALRLRPSDEGFRSELEGALRDFSSGREMP